MLSPSPSEPAVGAAWAPRDDRFEVTQGQIIGVAGRNSAGKSAPLKLLSRVSQPPHGQRGLRGPVALLAFAAAADGGVI